MLAAVPPQRESNVLVQPEPRKGYSGTCHPFRRAGDGEGGVISARSGAQLSSLPRASVPLLRAPSVGGGGPAPFPRRQSSRPRTRQVPTPPGQPGSGGRGQGPRRRGGEAFLDTSLTSQAPVPNTRGRGPRDPVGCHCDTRDPALRVPGAGLRGCVEGSAPAGKAFKLARGELGRNSLFRSGYKHQPNAPRDRFKISSQSTAPGRGERHPTPSSIHSPPVRQRNSGPDVRCRAVSPQTKSAPTASCPEPTPGRRERRGRFRSRCVGRTCVAVIAGPGQGAGNRSLPVQHMLRLEAGSYTGTLPASAPSAQSAAGGKNFPLGSSGQLPPAFLISLGWGQICHVPVATLSSGVGI